MVLEQAKNVNVTRVTASVQCDPRVSVLEGHEEKRPVELGWCCSGLLYYIVCCRSGLPHGMVQRGKLHAEASAYGFQCTH